MVEDIEYRLLKHVPDNIKFVSRDEVGEIWLSEERPEVVEGSNGKFLSFPQPTSFENLYSLAVYNHLFNFLDKLSVMEIVLQGE